ncbi:MAG: glycosyltransferase [Beijerinckiaceae bacterium]
MNTFNRSALVTFEELPSGPSSAAANSADDIRFGREVLGPVFAEFALRLWTALSAIPHPKETKLLFCARGGLRLRLVYERFLASTRLESPVALDDLMISRVVAARGAVLAGSQAAEEEIAREFQGDTMRRVAQALTAAQSSMELYAPTALLDAILTPARLRELIFKAGGGLTPAGEAVREQHFLFLQHLSDIRAGASHVVLADTGLYGSTLRMIEHGVPNINWSCLLFARCNYKGFDTSHFARTVGLSVESERYSPFEPRTATLRYWQFFEHLLEPALPSVRRFDNGEMGVHSNLQIDGWHALVHPQPAESGLFAGLLHYLDHLDSSRLADIFDDAAEAWRKLHHSFVWPTRAEAHALAIGERSRDFGRSDSVAANTTQHAGFRQRFSALRGSLWREGAAAAHFPLSRLLVQTGLQAFHLSRFMRGRR